MLFFAVNSPNLAHQNLESKKTEKWPNNFDWDCRPCWLTPRYGFAHAYCTSMTQSARLLLHNSEANSSSEWFKELVGLFYSIWVPFIKPIIMVNYVIYIKASLTLLGRSFCPFVDCCNDKRLEKNHFYPYLATNAVCIAILFKRGRYSIRQ